MALAGGADLGSDDDPSAAASVTELVLGGLLLLVAPRQWRSRPRGDEPAAPPSWMAAVDQVTPVQAAGFGVHHSVVNPKNRRLRVWAGARLRGPLDELKGWLQANNATVMAVLLLVLGAACWGRDSVDCSAHPLRVRERHAGGATVSRRGPVRHPRRR